VRAALVVVLTASSLKLLDVPNEVVGVVVAVMLSGAGALTLVARARRLRAAQAEDARLPSMVEQRDPPSALPAAEDSRAAGRRG